MTVDVLLSQKEILLIISEANPNNTLDWNESDNFNDWEEVGLNENGMITVLSMVGKCITILPAEIGQLSGLEILNLTNNKLTSLHAEIGQLNNLQVLFLRFNENLNGLPPEIGKLNSLKELFANPNNLSSLPPEIGQLSSLETLDLGSNKLNSLPVEITELVNLKSLNLANNNLSQFDHIPFIPSDGLGDVSALDCSTETNLEFLSLRGNPIEELNQCICDLDTNNGGTVDIVYPDGVRCVDNNVIGD